MQFTQVATDAFSKIQLNAGILLTTFNPTTPAVVSANIIGATSGGNTFIATPTYQDFGADIDNVPENTKQLKKLDQWVAKLSGTFVTVDTAVAKMLCGAADVASGKVTPRTDLAESDFSDIWWVGDYSDKNTGANAGFIAIKLANALSTGGISIKSTDKGKGQMAYEFTGHYDMTAMETAPFEVYIKTGTAAE